MGTIFSFWSPLALTWFMMSMEGPFLAALIARLADPKPNLAAYGVAFAIAILVEAPVIMIMSASTALARDRTSYMKLRNFTYALNFLLTLGMVLLLFTPAMDWITRTLIGLPEEVARLVHTSLIILLPWPGAIGYRRFFQGILIRGGQTRRVTYGTAIRLSTMAVTGLILYLRFDLPGALVGAASLSSGVLLEAVAARWMARNMVHRLLTENEFSQDKERGSSYRAISRFYYPLALTSTIALAAHPMVTFFVGQAKMPLESLAVIPVVNSLVFIFRAIGLSFQEAAIALMGEKNEHYKTLKNFAAILALCATGGLTLIAFTPLSKFWFERVSGLSEALAAFATPPAMILAAIPALSVLLSFQRATLVKARTTWPITVSTVLEVGGIILILFVGIHLLDLVGAVAAAAALLLGRIAGNIYLIRPCAKAAQNK
ncbi:MAG: hypothetical protein KJ645_13070 [Planctomycetes bacterium]|nr:hypothetical protein [Planctomycetota bacterium]